MRHTLSIFTSLVFLALISFADSPESRVLAGSEAEDFISGAEKIRIKDESHGPNYIRFGANKEVPFDQIHFWAAKAFNINDKLGLELLSVESDELGYTHYRYRQSFNGVPIEHSMLILHVNNGNVQSLNGDYFLDLNTSVQPAISEQIALQKALDYINSDTYRWQVPGEDQHLQAVSGDPSASWYPKGELSLVASKPYSSGEDLRLTYKFDIYSSTPLSRKYIFIDAQSGEVVWEENRIKTVDTPGQAVTGYSGTQNIISDSFAGGFRLRESGRGNGVETYNMNNGTNYGAATDFTDADNFWDNANASLDEFAGDAHWGAEMTYDYFLQKHNRNSIDGNGMALLSYVHYGSNFGNAFWDGTAMTYGDGGNNNPFCALDVCGHEISHGLTERTANLIYANESGALNESFSDIFGVAVENFSRPLNWNWLLGEDIGAIRNLQNPNAFGDPDTYFGPNWYTGAGDNGGVHFNSGVQNHWFYILTAGATGVNGVGNSYSVTGIGMEDAGKVAFRNLTVYLTPGSEYEDARFFGIQSAVDHFGPCSAEVESTTNAWYAVNVGPPFVHAVIAEFSASSVNHCSAPVDVTFLNQTTNGYTFHWDFGDGNTSTDFNPTHTYTALGTYTVTLTVDGGPCGADTISQTSFINIDPANPCVVLMDPNNNNVTQTACQGFLFDSGGANNDYPDNTNSIITIAPTGASSVTLVFDVFEFELDWDYLYVYDGPTVNSPLIGQYTGYALPNGGTITSSGGSITVQQTTDQYITDEGFELSWVCFNPTAPPVAEFHAVSTTSCTGVIEFIDNSWNGPLTWSWDFGDGNTSTQQNPTHTYAASGTYTVVLTSGNANGADVMTHTNYITISKPPAPSVTGSVACSPGSFDLTVNGSGVYDWFTSPAGGAPIANGSVYNTGPISSTTSYYVQETVPTPSEFIGPSNNSIGTGGFLGSSQWKLFFDVYDNCELVSVWVNADGDANRVIEWRTPTGVVIDTRTVFIPDGVSRVNLGFNLVPGTGYELGGFGTMNLFRNNAGAAYPYVLAGSASITGSNAPIPGYYYFFYDWEVIPEKDDCVSERTEVTAVIGTSTNPVISPSGTVEICAGSSVTLSASGGGTFLWSNSQTGSSIDVSTAGTYSVTSTDANGCTGTSGIVTVVTGGTLTATVQSNGDMNLCPGETLTLNAVPAGPGYSYLWSNGATSSSIPVTTPGTYSVFISDGAGCDDTSLDVNVTASASPQVTISANGSTDLCPEGSIMLTATSDATILDWSNGDSGSSIVVDSPGTYSVTATSADGCSTVSNTITVGMAQLPTVSITPAGPVYLCNGDDLTIEAVVPQGTVDWSTGVNASSITVTEAGTYSYVYTDDVTGCDINSEEVVVSLSPFTEGIIEANGPLSFCDGGSVELTAPAGDSYLWSSGQTSQSITVNSTGSYSVAFNFPDGCAGNSQVVTVAVSLQPNAQFTFLANTLSVSFTNQSSGGTTWEWDFGDGAVSSDENPDHVYTAEGTYSVSLIVTQGSCSDTIQQEITVVAISNSPDLNMFSDIQVYPNPFSGELNFSLKLVRSGKLNIQLTDLLGREIAEIYNGEVAGGDWEYQWRNEKILASGSYLLKIDFNGERSVKKMIYRD